MKNKCYTGLLLALSLTLVGCGNTATEDPQATPSPSSVVAISSVVSDLDLTDNTQPDTAAITSEEIFRNESLVITTDSVDSDTDSTYLFLYLENLTDQDMYIVCESASINGILMDCSADLELPAGEKIYSPLLFNNTDLNICDITTLASVSFKLSAYTLESAEELFETDQLEVHTSQYETYTQTLNTDGQILYDENDIQLIAKGATLDPDETPVIVIFAINNSDKNVFLTAQLAGSAAENYETAYSYDLPAKMAAATYLNYYDEDGVIADDIKNIPVILSILDEEGEKEIGRTKALTFNSSIIEDYLAAGDFEEDPEKENIVSYSGEDAADPLPGMESDEEDSELSDLESDDTANGYYDEDGDYVGYDPNEDQYVEEDE